MRRAVAQRVAQMSDAIAEHFPAECSVSTPQGGFVLWVQLPESVDTLALHKRALQHKIAFMPGSLFSASGKYRNCLRLNCGNLWSPEIENAVKTLGGLAHEQAS
jgi:DNA-binding transcriptional MocR family regulator